MEGRGRKYVHRDKGGGLMVGVPCEGKPKSLQKKRKKNNGGGGGERAPSL